MTVTANDVKQRGGSLFGEHLEKFDEYNVIYLIDIGSYDEVY